MRVGIEVGSTFTDLVAVDGSRVEVIKVPSTPASPYKGAFASFEAVGLDPAVVTDLVHGSTVTTNALKSKDAVDLLPGDIVTLAGGGGGGFGDPAKRSAERLREDQADGIISADRAASWASSRIAAE